MSLEDVFSSWAQPPGEAERQRCEHTVTEVKAAIAASDRLRYRETKTFVHGSFRNNVNVREESDVDVGVRCADSPFFYSIPAGYTGGSFGIVPATYHYPEFKRDVGNALYAHFGSAYVTPTNKTFEVRATRARVDSDVTPFFPYREYDANGDYVEGVKLIADDQTVIINWPEQNYANGVAKNDRTRRGFKGAVRILKKISFEMEENGVPGSVCGFLIEGMTYNVPNVGFAFNTWTEIVKQVLAVEYTATRDDARCAHWTETNERKLLFEPHQKWTREQAHGFTEAAWRYLRF
jgi:hypothetical protein